MKKQNKAPEKRVSDLSSDRLSVKHRTGLLSSPRIIPFIGYGNKNSIYISGLVVEENGISKPFEGQSKWKNIIAMLKRYTSNELENINVEISCLGEKKVATTDKYGVFRCNFQNLSEGDIGERWQKFSVNISNPGHGGTSNIEEGEMLLIDKASQFAVISDIDDTILVSYATNTLMKLRLMLLNNAHTRMPFAGVGAFYHALQQGTFEDGYNPVFYVSNSEWNLYDLLYEFIQFHRIPKGPLMLRELAINFLRPWKLKEVNKNHKSQVIRKLLSLYSEMKFILIGDSGQKDPEIYFNIIKEHPGRILAVYIRDVGISRNLSKISVLSDHSYDEFKTEIIVVKDTIAAAQHAVEKGFISSKYLDFIRGETEKDLQKISKPAEKLV